MAGLIPVIHILPLGEIRKFLSLSEKEALYETSQYQMPLLQFTGVPAAGLCCPRFCVPPTRRGGICLRQIPRLRFLCKRPSAHTSPDGDAGKPSAAHQTYGGSQRLQPLVEKRHDDQNSRLPLASGTAWPAAGGGPYRQVLRMAV